MAPVIGHFNFGDKPSHPGQYQSLQCSVSDGDLPLTISWTFNGQPIVNSDDAEVSVTKMGRRSSVLTIEQVAPEHAGRYVCLAENAAGAVSFAADLRVIGVFLDLKRN